ncbi:hypothetical protein RFI_36416 [Reticulomyxa filosa]|uniref:Uncharacterized protein n=1 Tax=Reticulomyxa filosa TaxID=46433 RepID=X6LGA9_RETFI|nr:hypothetical protein RFI_36416 [Reticulomyxa filosa]|eukprot:ETO01023.1 hypothetical protein RFI_36416 [Reticulomyxa filosa]
MVLVPYPLQNFIQHFFFFIKTFYLQRSLLVFVILHNSFLNIQNEEKNKSTYSPQMLIFGEIRLLLKRCGNKTIFSLSHLVQMMLRVREDTIQKILIPRILRKRKDRLVYCIINYYFKLGDNYSHTFSSSQKKEKKFCHEDDKMNRDPHFSNHPIDASFLINPCVYFHYQPQWASFLDEYISTQLDNPPTQYQMLFFTTKHMQKSLLLLLFFFYKEEKNYLGDEGHY